MALPDRERIRTAARLEQVVVDLTGSPLVYRAGNREPVVRCPFHDDQHPSLRVNIDKQVWCCDPCGVGGDVFAFVGRLKQFDFREAVTFLAERYGPCEAGVASREPIAVYPYPDEQGTLLFEVCRFEPKVFRQRRPNGHGGYIWNLNGTRRVLYRLPQLFASDPAREVLVVEGEKDVDRLAQHGFIATTNPHGAGKWRDDYSATLSGRHAVILPDNDDAGERHALQVAASLYGRAASVKVVRVPGLPPKGDTTDYFDAGGTVDALADLVRDTPEWAPTVLDATPAATSAVATSGKNIDALLDGKAGAWSTKLADAAYHGLPGEIVRAIEPHTEADPAALLFQLLVVFGNVVGHGPHFHVAQTRHALNLYVVVVGATSKARKGTSWQHVRSLLELVDPEWVARHVQSNLSSGEGLIYAVRDPKLKLRAGRPLDVMDDGVVDKRLLVYETEFAAALAVLARDGNTLSTMMRQAWDTGTLRVLTKNDPSTATDAHISIIGHITREELMRRMRETELFNGFANRFLWVYAQRARTLPFGGSVDGVLLQRLAELLREAVKHASGLNGPLPMDESARELWADAYDRLSEPEEGVVGAVTSRAEAQVSRLAAIYALLDSSEVISRAHLEAALAVWTYADASARFVFGGAERLPRYVRLIADALRARQTMTRTDIRDIVGGNVPGAVIGEALRWLEAKKLVEQQKRATGGRDAEVWLWKP